MFRSKIEKCEALRKQLDIEKSTFEAHWRDLSDFILPRRARFYITDVNKGDKRNQKIIDSTATYSAGVLRAGMMSGVTSPARPWFKLTTPDPELAEVGAVKVWLEHVTNRMATSMLRSNLYNSLPVLYGDLGVFGTAAMYIEEDFDSVFHTRVIPIGSFSIGVDDKGRPGAFSREFRMTVRQLIEKFNPGGFKDVDWSRFSSYVKSQWDIANYETWVDVCHVIMINDEYDPEKLESKYKKYVSYYYEKGNSGELNGNSFMKEGVDRFLSESGYDYFPVLCPRWEVTGEDCYGTSCPGMVALGDIKALQTGEKRIAQAVEKMVNPPLKGPSHLRTQKVSLIPGDITYTDERGDTGGLTPIHQVNFRINEAEAKQEQVRARIRKAFYEDLFLMLANTNRSGITAREIDERHEEKLLALGPVLEQINQDLLDPLIDIVFRFHIDQELIPEPPDELKGIDLKVEYVSIMAQSQKLVGLAGLERFAGFVGQAAGLAPDILDKINVDQMIDVYGDITSISPTIIRTDDEVAQIRQQRAQAQAQAQQAQQLQSTAKAMKDLGSVETEGDNAMAKLIQGGGI